MLATVAAFNQLVALTRSKHWRDMVVSKVVISLHTAFVAATHGAAQASITFPDKLLATYAFFDLRPK